jgi:hypothetical protein
MRPAPLTVVGVACAVAAASPTAPAPVPDGKPALREPGERSPRIASYRIDASLDPKQHKITATETLTWKNTSAAAVDKVPLHLYMNAFKNDQTVFMRESGGQMRGARAGSWGWIDVPSIKQGDAELRAGATFGEDETTLTVPLATPVEAGGTLTLDLAFTTQLPLVFARTGYRGDFEMIGQWFPKIGVLQADGWHCDTFHANSEFFADFGVYDVNLTVPTSLVVAATGVLTAVADADGARKLTYHAEDVHDFAWMADPRMRVMKGMAGDVEVRVYYRPEQEAFARRHLAAGIRSVEGFSERFVPYAWSIISIIDPPNDAMSGAGGMEYPTLITTAGDVDLPGQHFAEGTTVHEVGHNWFQGMVASNEVDEAYLDEGVNEYVDGLILDPWFGEGRSELDHVLGFSLGYYPEHQDNTDSNELVSPVATKSYEFAPREYGAVTYSKTLLILKTLENLVGRDKLVAAVGAYAKKYAFQHPSGEQFRAAIDEGLGGGWRAWLDAAFTQPGGVDYRITETESTPVRDSKPTQYRTIVGVVNRGRLTAPVTVDLTFDDGAVVHESWDGQGGFRRFDETRPARLARVDVDPGDQILLAHDRLEESWREDERSGASWRAAARASFWEQTLLQLVGP